MNANIPRFVKLYFKIIALLTCAIGLTLLFLPSVSSIFFKDTPESTLFFVQIIGCTLLGYATLNTISVLKNNHEVYEVAAWSNLVTLAVATLLCVIFQREIEVNSYLLILQHLIFMLGFIYCAVVLKSKK